MDLQLLPVRATLVDLRVQVLQAARLPALPPGSSALTWLFWDREVSHVRHELRNGEELTSLAAENSIVEIEAAFCRNGHGRQGVSGQRLQDV
jgi:hypothetical protein